MALGYHLRVFKVEDTSEREIHIVRANDDQSINTIVRIKVESDADLSRLRGELLALLSDLTGSVPEVLL